MFNARSQQAPLGEVSGACLRISATILAIGNDSRSFVALNPMIDARSLGPTRVSGNLQNA